jgi:hypothetical protein
MLGWSLVECKSVVGKSAPGTGYHHPWARGPRLRRMLGPESTHHIRKRSDILYIVTQEIVRDMSWKRHYVDGWWWMFVIEFPKPIPLPLLAAKATLPLGV